MLFMFGTGPIKGFAVTLSVGVLLNLFTALFGTRVVYDWLLIKRWIKKLSFFEFFKQPNIDFIGWRHYAFAFSGVLCILGIIGFVQLSRGYGNLGVEFSGGTLVQIGTLGTEDVPLPAKPGEALVKVRMAGVLVGSVERIFLKDGMAHTLLRIDFQQRAGEQRPAPRHRHAAGHCVDLAWWRLRNDPGDRLYGPADGRRLCGQRPQTPGARARR